MAEPMIGSCKHGRNMVTCFVCSGEEARMEAVSEKLKAAMKPETNYDKWHYSAHGWASLVDPCLIYADEHGLQVQDVKEKFGVLRVYWNGDCSEEVEEEMNSLVLAAETLSFHTCQRCGLPGKQCGTGWMKVRCQVCFVAEEKRK